MNYVIGSGPAGISAAVALLNAKEEVTLLDAGGELEREISDRVRGLSRKLPADWVEGDRAKLRGDLRYNAEGAPLKLAFGSDFVYRDTERLQPVELSGVDAYRSLATGGLSALWGASMLPYNDADLAGWPLRSADLAPHYRAALSLTGLSGESDELERLYPLHIRPTANLAPSEQARFLFERMRAHARDLERAHLHFGKARLAISAPQGVAKDCTYCGMCLYGCPYGMIYSAQLTLEKLKKLPGFHHRPGFVARKLVERESGVRIHAIARESGLAAEFEASRVFLGTGTLGSTAILLESLGAAGEPISLRQSDHFLLPMILRKPFPRVASSELHTLSQIFLEIMDPALSRNTIHLQIYTYNDFYSRMAREKLGPIHGMAAPFLDRFFDRVILIKGYLHSDDSSSIGAKLRETGLPGLQLEAQPNPRGRALIRSVVKLLSRNSRSLGAMPLGLGLRYGLPGSGVHVGGGFPMSARPEKFQTDLQGRPIGFKNVHVVDSSVFPTIPAPTITLTTMANAHRIASEVHQGKGK